MDDLLQAPPKVDAIVGNSVSSCFLSILDGGYGLGIFLHLDLFGDLYDPKP